MARKAAWEKGAAAKIKGTHGNNKHVKEYRDAVRESIQNLNVLEEIRKLLHEDWVADGFIDVKGVEIFHPKLARLTIEQNKAKLAGWGALLKKTLPDLKAVEFEQKGGGDKPTFVISAQPMTLSVDEWMAVNGIKGPDERVVNGSDASSDRKN